MLKPVLISYGTDPELFLTQRGNVIGSEKVIPEEGLKTSQSKWGNPSIVRDGVQVELNPASNTKVASVGLNMSMAFGLLKTKLAAHPEVECCFKGVVDVSREELDSLSEKSRVLGCMPSRNIYGVRPIKVNPETFRQRSAGGHLHFGLTYLSKIFYNNVDERQSLVPLLDIFVGNTCVLLDRDPMNAVRRRNYGRAGEYRLPDHGLEYRTLSSFWLRNYSLMSLVFGLGNMATAILHQSLNKEPLEAELKEVVNIKRVATAINRNSYRLAKMNFEAVMPFLAKHLPTAGFPFNPSNLDKFLTFAEGVKSEGLERYFPVPTVDHWVSGQRVEFDTFLGGL